MRKKFMVLALVLCTVLLLAACGGSSSPIVGKWKDETTGMSTIEFKADGTLSAAALGQTITGTYKIDGDKITTNVLEQEATATFKVEGNKLTITSDGVSTVYDKQ